MRRTIHRLTALALASVFLCEQVAWANLMDGCTSLNVHFNKHLVDQGITSLVE
jgi:succinate dehydrogenase/fumarate reductase cytochrome b subunit